MDSGRRGQDRGRSPGRALGRASGRGDRSRIKERTADVWRPLPCLKRSARTGKDTGRGAREATETPPRPKSKRGRASRERATGLERRRPAWEASDLSVDRRPPATMAGIDTLPRCPEPTNARSFDTRNVSELRSPVAYSALVTASPWDWLVVGLVDA